MKVQTALNGKFVKPGKEHNLVKLRYIATGVMLSTAVSAAGLAMTAVPVTAGECRTPRPGCGGVVEFDSDAAPGRGVYISNCWSGTGTTYSGDILQCAATPTGGIFSPNKNPAMYFLLPGQSSSNYAAYYDTDAYKVDANCVLTTNNTTIDRRGLGPIWYRIRNVLGRVNVRSYRCF